MVHDNKYLKDQLQSDGVYTPLWQGYIVSNYLFYSSLVVHFLGFAHKFLHANAETITQMVLKIKDSDEEMVDATTPKANNKQSSIKSEKKGLKTPTTPQNVRRAQKVERPAIEQIDLDQFPRGL